MLQPHVSTEQGKHERRGLSKLMRFELALEEKGRRCSPGREGGKGHPMHLTASTDSQVHSGFRMSAVWGTW